jgi:hypothetical protein
MREYHSLYHEIRESCIFIGHGDRIPSYPALRGVLKTSSPSGPIALSRDENESGWQYEILSLSRLSMNDLEPHGVKYLINYKLGVISSHYFFQNNFPRA